MDPGLVLLAMWALGLASPTAHVWLNIFVIIIGVTMTAFGEIKFVLSGFFVSGCRAFLRVIPPGFDPTSLVR
jgi:hypothetical protein